MNIDLLLTQQRDAGLVSDQPFESKVAGIMFDAQTRQLTLEFTNMDTFDLNIPVEDEVTEALLWAMSVQVGVITDGKVQENQQVPLLLLNDPAAAPGNEMMQKPSNSVIAFERFLKACVTGQPIHRDDLGDEDVSGSVMGSVNRSLLQFAPHLARQKTLEASHDLNMSGPSAPGMGMGGGGGGGAPLRARTAGSSQQHQQNNNQDKSTREED